MKTFDVIRSFGIISNKGAFAYYYLYTSQDCKFHNLVVGKQVAILQVKNYVLKRVSPSYSDIIFNQETPIRKNRKIRRIAV